MFHTLRTKLGIKDSEKHLVLKYHICRHRYILEEMEFLDISSLGTTYRYATKIEQKFKQKKWEFGSMNEKQGKCALKLQKKGQSQAMAAQNNLPKPQANNNTTKPKKDMGKWCEFHKSYEIIFHHAHIPIPDPEIPYDRPCAMFPPWVNMLIHPLKI